MLLPYIPIFAQVDVGIELSPGELFTQEKPVQIEKKTDRLGELIATYFDLDKDKIQKLFYRGYGYNELIKLAIIARKSGTPFDELIKNRAGGEKLKNLAQRFHLYYPGILQETNQVRINLETELMAYTTSYAVSKSTFVILNESTTTVKSKPRKERK